MLFRSESGQAASCPGAQVALHETRAFIDALFKVPGHDGNGMWRVVFPAPPEASQEELFDEASVQGRIQGFNPKDGPYEMYHRNLYDVHQRVASSYRDGRLLVAGDAAHINNPLGGMGMNFGLHDSFNLTEKLSRVCA